MRLIPAASLPVSRWHNGAGRKADIATGDGWLTGFAWLDADAPFSALHGFDRTITLVEGPGFTLDIAGRAALAVTERFTPAAFDGGAPTQCRIAGPCRVLNVMTARDRFRHHIAITPPGPLAITAGVANLVVLLQGSATIEGHTLAVLDAVHLETATTVEGPPEARLAAITIVSA